MKARRCGAENANTGPAMEPHAETGFEADEADEADDPQARGAALDILFNMAPVYQQQPPV